MVYNLFIFSWLVYCGFNLLILYFRGNDCSRACGCGCGWWEVPVLETLIFKIEKPPLQSQAKSSAIFLEALLLEEINKYCDKNKYIFIAKIHKMIMKMNQIVI